MCQVLYTIPICPRSRLCFYVCLNLNATFFAPLIWILISETTNFVHLVDEIVCLCFSKKNCYVVIRNKQQKGKKKPRKLKLLKFFLKWALKSWIYSETILMLERKCGPEKQIRSINLNLVWRKFNEINRKSLSNKFEFFQFLTFKHAEILLCWKFKVLCVENIRLIRLKKSVKNILKTSPKFNIEICFDWNENKFENNEKSFWKSPQLIWWCSLKKQNVQASSKKQQNLHAVLISICTIGENLSSGKQISITFLN